MIRPTGTLVLALLWIAALAGVQAPGTAAADPASEIYTVLPKDAIPSIDDPKFASVREADAFMGPDEMVIGVEVGGEKRAYSVPLLSSHEIVNDVVGGRKIAVTW